MENTTNFTVLTKKITLNEPLYEYHYYQWSEP